MKPTVSASFLCKKWTIITLNVLQIAGIALTTFTLPEQVAAGTIVLMVVVMLIIGTGFAGVLLEKMYLTTVYAVLMTVLSIGAVVLSVTTVHNVVFWVPTFVMIVVSILSYSFANDLKRKQRPRETFIVVQSNHQNPNNLFHIPNIVVAYQTTPNNNVGANRPLVHTAVPFLGPRPFPQNDDVPPKYNETQSEFKEVPLHVPTCDEKDKI